MPIPLGLLLGGLATVGSTVANAAAARQAAKARDNALAAERIRQGALDREAQALNASSQDRFQDFEGKQGEKAKGLGDYFATAETSAPPDPGVANALAASVSPVASNDIVTRENAKQLGRAKAFTDQQAGALGELRSFGDLLGDTSRAQGRDASLLGQIGGFKRGSSNILPLELDAAAQKGSGLRLLGDILGGVGSIGINAGLTGGGGLGKLFGGASAATGPITSSIRPRPRPANLGTNFSGVY
jgi:hypothetical protein